MKNTIIMLILLLAATAARAQQSVAAEDVLTAARKVNEYFMKIWPDPTTNTFVRRSRPSSLWTRGVYYEGLMALYGVDPQQKYLDYTDRWANHHLWTPRYGTGTTHADDQCCMQTYLDRYIMGCKEARTDSVRLNMKNQIATGRNDYWTWIDAIQMAMPAYSRMYRITHESEFLDYAMRSYLWTRDSCGTKGMFNEKDGLWWRDADFDPPYAESDGNNCYWSRGNGWVYAALVRVMDDLMKANDLAKDNGSAESKESKRLSRKAMKHLQKDFMMMSKALLRCQRNDGFWNVSLHSEATFGGPEASGTALFLYGLSWGIRHGLLKGNEYRTAADRACHALIMTSIQPDGFIGYMQGTGKEPKDGQPLSTTKIPDFEDYGTGCVLLGLCEYYMLMHNA